MGNVDKKLLKRLKLLYVEDDTSVRNELTSLLSSFFDNVYTAQNGQEGLDIYIQKQEDIDIIIADINMPRLSGIEMLEKIRVFDKDIPVIFTTAYSDIEFLIDAIKLKVFEYIIKPIDIRQLMKSLAELSTIIYHDFLLKQQNKELKKYKDIIYDNNIVLRTNKNMKITFVNDLFCEITGFDKKDLIGQELYTIRHKDSDSSIYKKIYASVNSNKLWKGQLKNLTKDGNYYIADTTIITTLNDAAEVTGSLVIQKDETKEALKRRDTQSSLIKDKSEIFKKSKESSAELLYIINSLKDNILQLKKELKLSKQDIDKYIYTAEKFTLENKKLKVELNQYKKNANIVEEKNNNNIKLSKENVDLKVHLKRLNVKLETIQEEHEKQIVQIKVNHEIEIDDLEQELNSLKEKLDGINDAEGVSQKLAYWKEKAKSEAKKLEKIEREVINYGDKNIMKRLFGGK